MKTTILLVLACLFTASFVHAVEVRHAAPGEYGPIPRQVIDALFTEHGFTAEQRKLFTVIRLVPFELGGTNAKKNLMIVSPAEAQEHYNAQAILIAMSKSGRTTYDKAAAQLAAWKPGQRP